MEKKKRIKVILLVLAVGAVFVGAIIFAVTWNHASESSSNPVTPTEKIETSTEVGDFEEPIVPPIVPNDANQKPSENSPDVEVDVEDYRPNLGPEVMDVEITYDTKEDTKNEEKNN